MNEPKSPKNICKQIAILKDRGCEIHDKSFAKETLSKINYYRLITYLLPFKNGKYKEKTTFEKIVSLHEFDRKLRSLLLQVIDCIEVTLRTRLASRIADLNTENSLFKGKAKEAAESYCKKISEPPHEVYIKIGEEVIFNGIENVEGEFLLLCQKEGTNTILVVPINQKAKSSLEKQQIGKKITLKKDYYKKEVIREKEFIDKRENIKKKIEDNKEPIVIYHKEHYGGELPFRVIIEFFTFGDLSRLLYKNLKPEDKKKIAKEFIPEYIPLHQYLESWLCCCNDVRNRCAHFGVLYNHVFPAEPKGLKQIHRSYARSLWISILVIKWLYPFQDKWDEEFISQIENLVKDSKLKNSDLRNYGFPKTWKEELKKPKKESLYSWISFSNC